MSVLYAKCPYCLVLHMKVSVCFICYMCKYEVVCGEVHDEQQQRVYSLIVIREQSSVTGSLRY